MNLTLAVRSYGRPFRHPLQTHHGPWRDRRGWLIQLLDQESGAVGWGEVAPIPWFGTESLAAAATYLDQLLAQWPTLSAPVAQIATLQHIPDTLPACQFGLGIALAAVVNPAPPPPPLSPQQLCALLPREDAAPARMVALGHQGHRSFKVKIAVGEVAAERVWVESLLASLPPGASLRLDANGGLSRPQALDWLTWSQTWGPAVEFVEQPLPPQDWAGLQALGAQFPGRVALDESVATVAQLRRVAQAGWSGPVVIKPAIAGPPLAWLTLCQHFTLEPILSSALETPVGRQGALAGWEQWRHQGSRDRPLGFGIGHWFADDWDHLSPPDLWHRLPPDSDPPDSGTAFPRPSVSAI